MTPEEQLNKILGHLEELQNLTIDLHSNISDLSVAHSELSHPSSDVHPDLANDIGVMHSILSAKMDHTETMVQNLLHPDRINHLTNFMSVMNDALNPPPEEE